MSETPENNSPLDRLKTGVRQFQAVTYASAAAEYRYAATHPQQPHTLFITCSDSRIGVESLTSTGPGQLFVARNVGNLVPPYGRPLSDMAAVIEYAVAALKVQHVVVCGHSDCGAMKAILNPPATAKLPSVRAWLQHAESTPGESSAEALRSLTERNVLQQMENLKTHPAVVDALNEARLTLSGWVYEIGSGEVRIAEGGSDRFEPVRGGTEATPGTVTA